MPSVTRLGDASTGHGSFPPTTNNSASSNVFCNGIAVVRVSDTFVVHTAGLVSHVGSVSVGSSKSFVNNQSMARIGDAISCGDVIAGGSSNVFSK